MQNNMREIIITMMKGVYSFIQWRFYVNMVP